MVVSSMGFAGIVTYMVAEKGFDRSLAMIACFGFGILSGILHAILWPNEQQEAK